MSEIKDKIIKEVEEIVGYSCDICNNEINIDKLFVKIDLNTLTYTTLSGGWGEGTETIKQHVCSKECLVKALKSIPFDANLHLSNKLILELIKGVEK